MPSFSSLALYVPVAVMMAFTPGPATLRWASGLILVGLGVRLPISKAR